MPANAGPCLCGDPLCKRCFPGGYDDEDESPIVWYYGCVECQQYHYQGDPLYDAHIWRQDKHGLRRGQHP